MDFMVGTKIRHKKTGKILEIRNIFDEDEMLVCTDGFVGDYWLAFSVAEPYSPSSSFREELVKLGQLSNYTRSRQWQTGFKDAIEIVVALFDASDFGNEPD